MQPERHVIDATRFAKVEGGPYKRGRWFSKGTGSDVLETGGAGRWRWWFWEVTRRQQVTIKKRSHLPLQEAAF